MPLSPGPEFEVDAADFALYLAEQIETTPPSRANARRATLKRLLRDEPNHPDCLSLRYLVAMRVGEEHAADPEGLPRAVYAYTHAALTALRGETVAEATHDPLLALRSRHDRAIAEGAIDALGQRTDAITNRDWFPEFAPSGPPEPISWSDAARALGMSESGLRSKVSSAPLTDPHSLIRLHKFARSSARSSPDARAVRFVVAWRAEQQKRLAAAAGAAYATERARKLPYRASTPMDSRVRVSSPV